ncbi:hypothetical protein [Rhizomonospora bruguierae]|uniref:hypothetical protein n=1 Tax=Rhizomonospora bruguierae TaxID=1581705 RepID=UPI001BD0DAC0|nr:hypothetical protein [Micromonospora sp. NBRC 107566]
MTTARSAAAGPGGQDPTVVPRSTPPGVIAGGSRGSAGSPANRYAPPRERQWPDRGREDESSEGTHEAADQRYWVTALWTVTWYAVPLALAAMWIMLGGAGDQRGSALGSLRGALPTAAGSLLISLLMAAMLRWAGRTWRPIWVGFAAAAVGAGVATVVFSAITGQSLS